MQNRSRGIAGASLAGAVLLLSACGDMNVKKYIPFAGDPVQERSRVPANATEYQCAGGKRIYVRTLDGGAAVWLILHERELRLDRVGTGNRYITGNTVLVLDGGNASVTDGGPPTYSACKTAIAEPPAAVVPAK